MENRKFKSLIVLVWLGFAIDLISAAIGCFDVREYYSSGQCGCLVFQLLGLLLSVWLNIALMRRKSWARKAVIVLTIILYFAVFLLSPFLEWLTYRLELSMGQESHFSLFESLSGSLLGDNPVIGVLDDISGLLSLYCLYLCLSKEVVSVFLMDWKACGTKKIVNWLHGFVWWSSGILLLIGGMFFNVCHKDMEQWKADCVEAAVAGSKSARKEFIDKMVEETTAQCGISSESAEEYAAARKMAEEYFDQQILKPWKQVKRAEELVKAVEKFLKETDGRIKKSHKQDTEFAATGMVKVINGNELKYGIGTDEGTGKRYAVVTGANNVENSLAIPAEIDGCPVERIRGHAFSGCTNLTSVTIPDSVKDVGEWAFAGCTRLTRVTIPASVKSIGMCAFCACKNLTDVTVPGGITNIGNAFACCSGLKSITIPDSVTSIESHAFEDCINLINVTIPNSVTSIGYGAFSGCIKLKSITIPDSVTRIGDFAFRECIRLESVALPDSVMSIGEKAFSLCFELENVVIPKRFAKQLDGIFDGDTQSLKITYVGE